MNAVLFAFNNRYPIFFTHARRPFRFDYLDPEIDLDFLKVYSGPPKSLTTFDDENIIGESKEILWERLLFLLSLGGNLPLSSLCHRLRYDGNTVVCSNEYSKIFEFKFESCFYFGDDGAVGFARQKELDEDVYTCYDYIAFNSGGKHEIDYVHTDDDFVREIWFYSSDRIDGNTPVRDACAVSKLTGEQLLNFDYSETMARFKVVHEMEQRGMKGQFAGGYTTTGNPKHYKFRTTSIRRETRCDTSRPTEPSENIKIGALDEQSLLEDLPAASLAYHRFLKQP